MTAPKVTDLPYGWMRIATADGRWTAFDPKDVLWVRFDGGQYVVALPDLNIETSRETAMGVLASLRDDR